MIKSLKKCSTASEQNDNSFNFCIMNLKYALIEILTYTFFALFLICMFLSGKDEFMFCTYTAVLLSIYFVLSIIFIIIYNVKKKKV